MRHFLSIDDLSPAELTRLLDDGAAIKKDPAGWGAALSGKHVALVFEKPSTRTRVSFEVAVAQMGGHALTLSTSDLQLGRGETIEDTARVLSCYVDAIGVRTFEHSKLERLASASSVPVINMLSDYSHPCQGLADLLTITEHKGDLRGIALAYLGDGNNVTHSLLLCCAKAGMRVRVASPDGRRPLAAVVGRAEEIAAAAGGSVTVTDSVERAVVGADVLYTDVWVSMGSEAETEAIVAALAPYQLSSDVVGMAADDAIVMHCLPAHRGEEITDEVIDGPQSVVWDQAENRLHAQKALLAWLLGAPDA